MAIWFWPFLVYKLIMLATMISLKLFINKHYPEHSNWRRSTRAYVLAAIWPYLLFDSIRKAIRPERTPVRS